MVIDNR